QPNRSRIPNEQAPVCSEISDEYENLDLCQPLISSRGVPEKTLNWRRDDDSSRKRPRAIAAARIVRVGTSVASSKLGSVCMNLGDSISLWERVGERELA